MKIILRKKDVVLRMIGAGYYFKNVEWNSEMPGIGEFTWAIRAENDMTLKDLIVNLYEESGSSDIRIKLFSSDGTLKQSFLQKDVKSDIYTPLVEVLDVKKGDYIAYSSGLTNTDIPLSKKANIKYYNKTDSLLSYYMDGDVDVFDSPKEYKTMHKIAFM